MSRRTDDVREPAERAVTCQATMAPAHRDPLALVAAAATDRNLKATLDLPIQSVPKGTFTISPATVNGRSAAQARVASRIAGMVRSMDLCDASVEDFTDFFQEHVGRDRLVLIGPDGASGVKGVLDVHGFEPPVGGFAMWEMLADCRRRSQEKGADASAGREGFSPCFELDVVADPVGVPPFHGIDEYPVDEHGEMEMIAAGQARGS